MNNITIIIRTANERTEKLCKRLLICQGIPENQIHVVREVPFSASMKKSFEIGTMENRKWTLCVDADVLPRPGSVANMINLADKQPERVCEIQGFILDKFFGGIRKGGFHLYRTSLLPKVIQQIPMEGVNIRPESHTLKKMAKEGFPRAVVPYIVGIHDEEQYNYDIYRKAFVYAEKHLDKADLLISYWKKNVSEDSDFRVALKAFSDSIMNTEQLFINTDHDLYKRMFKESEIEEKKKLETGSITLKDIEDKIQKWDTDENYYDQFPDSDGYDTSKDVLFRKIKYSLKNRGVKTTLMLIISQSFTKMGKKLGSRIPE